MLAAERVWREAGVLVKSPSVTESIGALWQRVPHEKTSDNSPMVLVLRPLDMVDSPVIEKGVWRLLERRCPLCRAEKLSHWYYEDDLIWIADCVICGVPMVVLKQHGLGTEHDLEFMVGKAKYFFGDGCWIDYYMRLIPDHRHF